MSPVLSKRQSPSPIVQPRSGTVGSVCTRLLASALPATALSAAALAATVSAATALLFIAPAALANHQNQPAAAEPKIVAGLTGNTAAKSRLIAEKRGIAPGGTVALALTFDVAPDWHLYWNGINDSGMQPTIKLDLPAGWTANQMQWIAPTRHVAPGDIVDHVMEGQVILIIPITAPATAKITDEATPLTIRGKASWLVCNEACLPGSADLAVVLAVVAKPELAKDTPDAPAFAAARAKHPKPLPTDGSVIMQSGAGSVTFSAPGAIGVTFYPEAESRKPTDMVSGVSTTSGTLTVAFDIDEAEKPVRGVLEIVRPAAASKALFAAKPLIDWYTISLPAAKTTVPAKAEDGK